MDLFLVNPLGSAAANNGKNNDNIKSNIYFADYSLMKFSDQQRLAFSITVVVFLVLSIVGNISTLFVNMRRKIRPFFRACLLSLACSDLLSSVFNSTTYLSQFASEFISLWSLGGAMCGISPFMSTTAILVNSMTLVGIALDRYMAVIKFIRGSWEPGGVFCSTCMILIWGLSAGIASPMISSYIPIDVTINYTDPKNPAVSVAWKDAQVCFSDKEETSYYYVIVFSIVFVPILIAFIWLNSIIAREIWNRRRAIDAMYKSSKKKNQESSSGKRNTSETNEGATDENGKPKVNTITLGTQKISTILKAKDIPKARTTRETRQLRMFFVIIVLMAVFIVCRLPAWIYLIMRLYSVYVLEIHWIIHFSFGILSLSSCFFNPLFYTFLTETIQYTLLMTKKIKNFCGLRRICSSGANKKSDFVPGNGCNGEIYTIYKDK